MKIWEAMKALEEGKKVRKVIWRKESYIMLNKKGVIVNEFGVPYFGIGHTTVPNERWELYGDRKEVKEEKLKELLEIVKEQKGHLNELYFQLLSMLDE